MKGINKSSLPNEVSYDRKQGLYAELNADSTVRLVALYLDQSAPMMQLEVAVDGASVQFTESISTRSEDTESDRREAIEGAFHIFLERMHDKLTSTIRCGFCGKRQSEVRKIIAGPTSYICDECVGTCSAIVQESFD